MTLTVYGGCYDGRNRVIVAAKSKKQAHALMAAAIGGRLSYHGWNEFTSDTGNDEELAVALASPGVVFQSPNDYGRSGIGFYPLSSRR